MAFPHRKPLFAPRIRTNGTVPILSATKTNGTATKASAGNYYQSNKIITNPRLLYSNVYGYSAFPSQPVIVRSSIEYATGSGIRHQSIYAGGTDRPSLYPGGHILSDPHPVSIPAATAFRVHTCFEVEDQSHTWPGGSYTQGGDNVALEYYEEGQDRTASGGTNGSTKTDPVSIGPTTILGDAVEGEPCIIAIGDSLMYGTGANVALGGFAVRGCRGADVGCLVAADSNITAQIVSGNTKAMGATFLSLAQYASHAIVLLGAKDVLAGTSAANIQTYLTAVFNYLNNQGIAVYACTIPPVGATSSDGYTTTGNQTAGTYNANRITVNNWIRGLPSPLAGFIEVATAVESAADSGKWKITAGAHTTDGTNMNDRGQIAAAVPVTTAAGNMLVLPEYSLTEIATAVWANSARTLSADGLDNVQIATNLNMRQAQRFLVERLGSTSGLDGRTPKELTSTTPTINAPAGSSALSVAEDAAGNQTVTYTPLT